MKIINKNNNKNKLNIIEYNSDHILQVLYVAD